MLCKADPEAAGAPLEAVPGVSGVEQMQTNVRTTEQKNCSGVLSFPASGQEPKLSFSFAVPKEDCPLVPLVPASQQMEGAADHEVLDNAVPTESVNMVQISALEKPELAHTASSAPREDESHVTLKISKPESAPEDNTVIEKSASERATQKKKKKSKAAKWNSPKIFQRRSGRDEKCFYCCTCRKTLLWFYYFLSPPVLVGPMKPVLNGLLKQ